MSKLEHQAEILKLARFLDVERDALGMLESVAAADIRRLREQATRHFFASDTAFFKRLVQASRLLPIPMLATVAEKVLGPMLSARVAGQMDVDRGVGIAQRLPTPFLADLCLSLDPGQTEPLIRAMPVVTIRDVGVELAGRGEYVTMARFVDIITLEALRAVMDAIDDDAAVLHTAFFVENKRRLENIMGVLPEDRLVRIIEATDADGGLWPEALALLEHVGDDWRRKLGDLAAGLDERILTSMIEAIHTHDLWSVALPVVTCMSPFSQQRFATLPAIQREEVLVDALRATDAERLWPSMLPLVTLMGEDEQAQVARIAGRLDGEQLLHAVEAAAHTDAWPALLTVIARMAPRERGATMGLIGVAPERTLSGLGDALEGGEHWSMLAAAWSDLADGARERLTRALGDQGYAERLPDGGAGA
ncbi:hypothetical protein [Algiphilus sp.]|uniref:hypothetical protein n=1 Tax=Algiphilus sp. TaxID=1872431 RepID=UPI0025C1CE20|nr:hypothetical protein [Algiphilus sp.]MCK5770971.1 hypothetical protein [Algiphilus sp.]